MTVWSSFTIHTNISSKNSSENCKYFRFGTIAPRHVVQTLYTLFQVYDWILKLQLRCIVHENTWLIANTQKYFSWFLTFQLNKTHVMNKPELFSEYSNKIMSHMTGYIYTGCWHSWVKAQTYNYYNYVYGIEVKLFRGVILCFVTYYSIKCMENIKNFDC